jgi:hypothetical protein
MYLAKPAKQAPGSEIASSTMMRCRRVGNPNLLLADFGASVESIALEPSRLVGDSVVKIRVQRSNDDEKIETISLKGKWEVIEGKYQNRISDESGLDHYFTHEGYYDGWGGAIRCDEQTAAEIVCSMEQKRETENI